MAIGLSLTPRGYNIDTTGKSYTLDPDPLLRAQERNFALQRESQRGIYDAANKGFQFIEYIGARQQLGRMKAQLSDLDPRDPAFANKYSDIILNNPLAFEHAATAQVARAALAPITERAKGVIEHQYKLEEIAALGRAQLATATARGDSTIEAAYTRGLFPRTSTRAPKGWESALQGASVVVPGAISPGETEQATDFVGPPSPFGVVTPGQGDSPIPEDELYGPGAATSGALLPTVKAAPGARGTGTPIEGLDDALFAQGPEEQFKGVKLASDQTPPFSAETEAVKKVDPGRPSANVPLGTPRVVRTQFGDFNVTGIGDDFKMEPYQHARKGPEIEGQTQIPSKLNADGTPAAWEYKPEIKASAAEIEQFTNRVKTLVESDPEVVKSELAATMAKAAYAAAKAKFDAIPKDTTKENHASDREAMLPGLTNAQSSADLLALQFRNVKAAKAGEIMRREDPKLAEMAHRGMQAAAAEEAIKQRSEGGEDFVGPPKPVTAPEIDATDFPPERATAPPVSGTAFEQLSGASPVNQTWTDEKIFALKEAEDLALRLGLTRDALVKAVEEGDSKSVTAVLNAAQERGVTSPLISEKPSRVGETGVVAPARIGWNESKKVGESYINVLKAAVKDTSLNKLREVGVSKSFSQAGVLRVVPGFKKP